MAANDDRICALFDGHLFSLHLLFEALFLVGDVLSCRLVVLLQTVSFVCCCAIVFAPYARLSIM
jgi:hypothetical protein